MSLATANDCLVKCYGRGDVVSAGSANGVGPRALGVGLSEKEEREDTDYDLRAVALSLFFLSQFVAGRVAQEDMCRLCIKFYPLWCFIMYNS